MENAEEKGKKISEKWQKRQNTKSIKKKSQKKTAKMKNKKGKVWRKNVNF